MVAQLQAVFYSALLACFQGIKRLYADIHDINVDVPAAYTLLDTLANKLHSKHVLEDSLMKDLPSRYMLWIVFI